ncbi:MAG TPA: hypothetical protein VIX37_01385 [Candidatus Sulfotelmatobacter sp.]
MSGANGHANSLPKTADSLVMTGLALDGKSRTVDISTFRPNRFADHQPIKTEYGYVDD